MSFGIENVTAPTSQNITDLVNVSDPTHLFININHTVYNGWLYFILLLIFWFILYVAAQRVVDQPIINMMYAGLPISIIALFMRIISFTENGIVKGLLSDWQMWMFPLITILLITFVIWTKPE